LPTLKLLPFFFLSLPSIWTDREKKNSVSTIAILVVQIKIHATLQHQATEDEIWRAGGENKVQWQYHSPT
jgi:hypothetical protein